MASNAGFVFYNFAMVPLPYLELTSNHAQLFSILLLTFFSKLNIPQRQINSLKNGDKWAPKKGNCITGSVVLLQTEAPH